MKNKRIMAALYFLLLFIVLEIYFVEAIGIIPARTILEYSPGMISEIQFTVVNTLQKDIKVTFSAEGELKEHIKLPEDIVLGREEGKKVAGILEIPNIQLTPGNHDGFIIATETISGSSSGVIAAAAVATNIRVRVPYPGKYADARIDVLEGSKLQFFVAMTNLGSEEIANALTAIEIINEAENILETLQTPIQQNIGPKKVAEFSAEMDGASLSSGSYIARAKIQYDGMSLVKEREFSIENEGLVITEVEVKRSQEDLIELSTEVVNEYSYTAEGVYAEFILENSEGVIATVKTAAVEIDAKEKKILSTYWENKDEATVSKVRTIVYYGGKTVSEEWSIQEEDDKPVPVTTLAVTKVGSPSMIAVGLVGVLVLLTFIGVLLWWKNRDE